MADLENWINPRLCSLNECVRIERGPQTVTLTCSDETLSDAVTHPKYRKGGRDAAGRLICPDDAVKAIEAAGGDPRPLRRAMVRDRDLGRASVETGGEMRVVDRAGQHAPWMWKLYKLAQTTDINRETGEEEQVQRWVWVGEFEGRDAALKAARKLYEKEYA
ncbi:hypothetical protein DDZ14_16060 [Maritimibacter sp. 55A14]|uniref:hypothetical protein n=1 Tax=Maritimibacter sp. 55A14 TaxID=2174844 RepID=UPI000D618AEF|nr:hypothetical protein [Maritimibacter sp. 55A14]PWE29955.1 hypothetical protein DDZ14_16060 [Maritimibacter sp. 55A14]